MQQTIPMTMKISICWWENTTKKMIKQNNAKRRIFVDTIFQKFYRYQMLIRGRKIRLFVIHIYFLNCYFPRSPPEAGMKTCICLFDYSRLGSFPILYERHVPLQQGKGGSTVNSVTFCTYLHIIQITNRISFPFRVFCNSNS